MPTPRSRRGLKAEAIAAAELGRLGYRLVDSNYRCRYGEIDLIAMDGETLVFIEVRSRSSVDFGIPSESITPRKIAKISSTAEHYLASKQLDDITCRFDFVSVVFREGEAPSIEVVKAAF